MSSMEIAIVDAIPVADAAAQSARVEVRFHKRGNAESGGTA